MTQRPDETPGPSAQPDGNDQPNAPTPPHRAAPPEGQQPAHGPGPGQQGTPTPGTSAPPRYGGPHGALQPPPHGAAPGGYGPPPGYGQQQGYGPHPGYGQQPGYGYSAPPGYAGYGYGPAVAMTPDDRTFGMLSHLLGIFTGFIGPLIVFLTKGKESPFIRDQSAESLNFQLTLLIVFIVSMVLMFVIIGFFTFFAAYIGGIIFMIIACLAANRGEAYRYPINIRMVK